MDRLEESLKSALARKDPPVGFVERVTAAKDRAHRPPGRMGYWWLAAAATIVMTVGSGVAYRQHQGELAKEQVMTAMRITAVKLNHIQAHVREVRQ